MGLDIAGSGGRVVRSLQIRSSAPFGDTRTAPVGTAPTLGRPASTRLRPRSRRGAGTRSPERRRPGHRPQRPGHASRNARAGVPRDRRGERTARPGGGHCVARRRRHLCGSGRPSPSRGRRPARAQV